MDPPLPPPPPPQPPQQPAASEPRRYAARFSASSFLHAPLSALLDYSSGILRAHAAGGPHHHGAAGGGGGDGEVSIRIVGPAEAARLEPRAGEAVAVDEGTPATSAAEAPPAGGGSGESLYHRYDVQRVARWVEHGLPFSLLLLGVFIRQHLRGFFVAIWIAAVMFKSNDILRKQTALKGERKIPMLVGLVVVFIIHVFGVYWWYRNDDLVRPLVMLPPKEIPPFWHAIFFIMVNDTMVCQAAMVVKCVLLMYYKNSKGRHYRREGRMLTVVEYFLLLYRALLPAPVWYQFFLNKEYGSLFSSLTTGLYLTFKVTSMVEKVRSLLAALSGEQWQVREGADMPIVQGAGQARRPPVIWRWFNEPLFPAFLEKPTITANLQPADVGSPFLLFISLLFAETAARPFPPLWWKKISKSKFFRLDLIQDLQVQRHSLLLEERAETDVSSACVTPSVASGRTH